MVFPVHQPDATPARSAGGTLAAPHPPAPVNLSAVTPAAFGAMLAFGAAARESLPELLADLVQLRVSQLNGCEYSSTLHDTHARAAGERPDRLAALADWRASAEFTERERVALALTECLTLIAGGVPDEVLHAAARHFTETELGQLFWTIAAANAWNRVAIPSRLARSHH
jgi:AhpD family alkylhydroperoxidase